MIHDGLDRLFADLPPVLSVPEVATTLGMTKAGVYRWLADGTIPGYRIAKSWFIVRDELKQTLRDGANPWPAHKEGRTGDEM